jgi:hypothetical protein
MFYPIKSDFRNRAQHLAVAWGYAGRERKAKETAMFYLWWN